MRKREMDRLDKQIARAVEAVERLDAIVADPRDELKYEILNRVSFPPNDEGKMMRDSYIEGIRQTFCAIREAIDEGKENAATGGRSEEGAAGAD